MADPFSIVTGIVGVLGVALSNKRQIYDFVEGIKGAPVCLRNLSNDLKSLSEVLEQIVGLTQDPSQATFLMTLKQSLERVCCYIIRA